MKDEKSTIQKRRSYRVNARLKRASRIERNQVAVGDAVNKIRTIQKAKIKEIDGAYKSMKLIQWEEFVEAYDELWRGSAYIPTAQSQALDRINAAVEKERALLTAYFESVQEETAHGEAANTDDDYV